MSKDYSFAEDKSNAIRLASSCYRNLKASEIAHYRELLKKGFAYAVRTHNQQGLESFIEHSEALSEAQIRIAENPQLAKNLAETEVLNNIKEVTQNLGLQDYSSAINYLRNLYVAQPKFKLKVPETSFETDRNSPVISLSPHVIRCGEETGKSAKRY